MNAASLLLRSYLHGSPSSFRKFSLQMHTVRLAPSYSSSSHRPEPQSVRVSLLGAYSGYAAERHATAVAPEDGVTVIAAASDAAQARRATVAAARMGRDL